MMNCKQFFELVEIKAKAASIFPCVLGSLYAWDHFHRLNFVALLVFFVAMVLFNMAVDANDNYQDFRRSQRLGADDFRRRTNIIGREQLSPQLVWRLIVGLIFSSAVLGLWLTKVVGWPVFWMGVLAFGVGWFYASGPRPIAATPFGELASGVTMGFVIWQLAVYINAQVWDWRVMMASGLAQTAIAALMLANNIADENEDLALKRRTIVYYLGRRRALMLFFGLYVAGFASMGLAVVLGWLPKNCALALISAVPVWRQAQAFARRPDKTHTFHLAVANLGLILSSFTAAYALGVGWASFVS